MRSSPKVSPLLPGPRTFGASLSQDRRVHQGIASSTHRRCFAGLRCAGPSAFDHGFDWQAFGRQYFKIKQLY